jgi:hypothetical protein
MVLNPISGSIVPRPAPEDAAAAPAGKKGARK